MSDKRETRTATEESADWMRMERLSRQPQGQDREKSAAYASMLLSTGASLIIATWASGAVASGIPRLAYAVGSFAIVWFVLLIALYIAIMKVVG